MLSERLVVHTNTDCECESLRQQVVSLEARISDLSERLLRGEEAHESNNLTVHAQQSLVERSEPSESSQKPNGEPASTFWSSRILRPTFTMENGQHKTISEALGSAWDLWSNDFSTETPDAAFDSIEEIPLSEYGEELIAIFFDDYWAHLPILHRPSFVKKHFEPVLQNTDSNGFSKFQVYMVFAIASSGRMRTVGGYHLSHQDFFRKATEYIPHALAASDLDCVQCLLLLCMYGRKEPQSVNMWHTTGLALRTATGIDLHKQESLVDRDQFQSEMAKRLFWSAYVMDRSMAVAMGRPLGISDSDVTLPLPRQLTDEQLLQHECPDSTPFTIPDAADTSTFIHVIKIRRLNAKIYTLFHSMGETRQADDLESLRTECYNELNTWLVCSPRYLRVTSMFQSQEWFEIAYHHAVLSVYRPSHALPIPTFEALQLCAESSISLITSYASLYAKNKVSYSFIALNSVFMAAITMLYSLRASSFVRQRLSETVARSNIKTCIQLCECISNGRRVAEKCSQIIERLGKATLASFQSNAVPDTQVDFEFLSWFGLKSHGFAIFQAQYDQNLPSVTEPNGPEVISAEMYDPPSIDMAWKDIFPQGMDFEDINGIDLPV